MDVFGGAKVKSASALAEKTGLVAVIYGAPGSGKTTFFAQAAGSKYGGRTLLLDADSGTRSVTHIEELDVITIESWHQFQQISKALLTEDHPWGTIILDNMSEYQSININSIVGSQAPQIQHWGKSTSDMMATTRFYRDLAKNKGLNVGMIAWESPEKDESSGIIKRDIGFTPSLARQFPGIVDTVGYLTVANDGRRVLTFQPSVKNAAKFRRSPGSPAGKIPLTITYTLEDKPIIDLLNTFRGNEDWPIEKYAKKVSKDD